MLFVSALAFQGFHYHEQDADQHIDFKIEKKSDVLKYSTAKTSCKLCDLIKNQSRDFVSPTEPISAITKIVCAGNEFGHLSGHTVAYILSATNKGPPAAGTYYF